MKKKLLSLGLIAVLLTGCLTGCGSNKNSVRMINVSYDPTRELFENYFKIIMRYLHSIGKNRPDRTLR